MALSDYQSLVPSLVRDTTGHISIDDIDTAIALAVARYSEDRPRRIVADIVMGPEGNRFPVPALWDEGASVLESIEYPVGEVPPAFIASHRIGLYLGTEGPEILLYDRIAAGETVRVIHSGRHLLDADHDTIQIGHREAVAAWAAGLLCEQIASHLAGNSEPTIQADTVQYSGPAKEYGRRAEALQKRYRGLVGAVEKAAPKAAGTVVAPAAKNNSIGGARLTHPLAGVRRP
jgi:hypothetical protein